MLKGLKVLEFQGLAPSVFLGMYFADQGAQVILIARPQPGSFSLQISKNVLNRNKLCISLSLKDKKDHEILIEMIKKADVIIDPYRPGVLEKQKLGPQELHKINSKIILLRVTGYGQEGKMALKPGHDLNYIATSGILRLINEKDLSKAQFPANYLADFVSASLGINGTLKAMQIVKQTNQGCVVDCSLAGGCAYLTKLVIDDKKTTKEQQIFPRISYFESKQKRYVVTSRQDLTHEQKQIQKIVSQMQCKNQQFFKNSSLQIAEIKKIKRIKDSNLKNPFNPINFKELPNKIPERDQHRKQILGFFHLTLKPSL